ncbi:MAG: reverse transcriptase domain-containing protein, partial [Bacteroidetes bacterium]|nr:reverse transcriptase domain-containing protein [Bacteroidota bacterium]
MKKKATIYNINSKTVHFQCLKNSFDLAHLLLFEFNSFKRVIENASYREFSIPKAKGGERLIEAPNQNLMFIQKRLNSYLQAVYYKVKPNSAYGFIQAVKDEPQKHTIITNANNHLGKNYVLNIDLKDFFHSIRATQVRNFFQSSRFNFSEDLATCIALICCWKSRLPMGAATSPVVSNLICLGLDDELNALANQYQLTYTRYADDLTFSSDVKFSEEVIAEIKKLIVDNKFIINKKKFRLQSKFRQQSVTGIKVNQKTNVDRRYIRNIRAVLNDVKINGIEKATMKHYKTLLVDEKLMNTFVLSIGGKINFIGQVRGKDDLVFNKLRE